MSEQAARSDEAAAQGQGEHRNLVFLVGRLSGPAEERTLPSGDRVAVWRLVVERPGGGPSARRAGRVDTIDCVAWQGPMRRRVQRWAAGDTIEVEGALRRRFWRSAGGGVSSRYEVEAAALRRVARASP